MTTPNQAQQNIKHPNGFSPKPMGDTKPATSAAADAKEATVEAKPAEKPTDSTAAATAAAADKKARIGRKIYLVTGPVREFVNTGDAEKFLNASVDAPQGEFVVIRGNRIEKKQRVSLR